MVKGYRARGWAVFPPEPSVRAWVEHARHDALRALSAPEMADMHQCEGTWFVGLDALANDTRGRVGASGPLTGAAVDFIRTQCGEWPELHRAQISGIFPGYPRPRDGETDAAFRYRRDRDAAHVDGVLGMGQPKRRFVHEPHAFVLGLPLTQADPEASPLVVWEGSHEIMAAAFQKAFAGIYPDQLRNVDVTDAYQSARRVVFDTCKRVCVWGPPGSAYVIHRLALHGVAPWAKGAQAESDGRLIAYFRPPMTGGVSAWAQITSG